MSIQVQCKKCGSSHSLNERMLGRSIRCPVCDATIDVQADTPVAKDENAEQNKLLDGEVVSEDAASADAEPVLIGEPLNVEGRGSPNSESLSESLRESNQLAEPEDEFDDLVFAKRELPKDDMDMTPMVDVTFLLLIFFMITASFTSEKVFEEPPPLSDKASTNAREEPEKVLDTVRVQVDEFNAYTIILPGGEDRQASSKQDLMIALGDARRELVTGANDDALKLAVEAHTESIHAAVVAAIDAGREKGFNSIQVTVVEEFN